MNDSYKFDRQGWNAYLEVHFTDKNTSVLIPPKHQREVFFRRHWILQKVDLLSVGLRFVR